MKTGLIVYVTGDIPQGWNEETGKRILLNTLEADALEIITRETGHYDVSDAWLSLLCKGMEHIVCKTAVFGRPGQLNFTDREMRLCGQLPGFCDMRRSVPICHKYE